MSDLVWEFLLCRYVDEPSALERPTALVHAVRCVIDVLERTDQERFLPKTTLAMRHCGIGRRHLEDFKFARALLEE